MQTVKTTNTKAKDMISEVKNIMVEKKLLISKEAEEKRLDDFKKISEKWDTLPDYAAGKLDGIISTFAMIYLNADKKVG